MPDTLKIALALVALVVFVWALRWVSNRFAKDEEDPSEQGPVFPERATPDMSLGEVEAGHDGLWREYFGGHGGMVAARHGLDDEMRRWREKLTQRLDLLFADTGQEEHGPAMRLEDVRPELAEALGGRIGTLNGAEAGYAALTALEDPNVRLSELSRLIMGNPLLSAKVLRCVNAAYFGLRGEVTSLPMAILILGMANMRSILYRESMSHLVDAADPRLGAFFDQVWEHLALTSVCCSHVARAFTGVDPGTLFTMGLLHDVGRFVIATSPLVERGQDAELAYDHRFTVEDEDEIFGVNHCLVGRMVADRWRLPRLIATTLEHHHAPAWADSLSLGLDAEALRYLAALFTADKLSGVFSRQEEHPEPLHFSFHEYVNRKALENNVLDPALSRDVKKAQEMALRAAKEVL